MWDVGQLAVGSRSLNLCVVPIAKVPITPIVAQLRSSFEASE